MYTFVRNYILDVLIHKWVQAYILTSLCGHFCITATSELWCPDILKCKYTVKYCPSNTVTSLIKSLMPSSTNYV